MEKKNLQVTKLIGMMSRKHNFFWAIFGVILLFLFSSFMISQNEDWKNTGKLIYKLSGDTAKKGGCENTKDALVLMEAYQIIYKEIGGLKNRREKANALIEVLKNTSCKTSVGDIVFNPKDINPAKITIIKGGVKTERKVEPYILALEMMTPKQKEEFQKALPQSLQLEYQKWTQNNADLKNEIKANMLSNEVMPVDLDKNLSNLFLKALNENSTIKLDDYKIDKKELNKLLSNQSLINELNKQVIIQKQ